MWPPTTFSLIEIIDLHHMRDFFVSNHQGTIGFEEFFSGFFIGWRPGEGGILEISSTRNLKSSRLVRSQQRCLSSSKL